MDLFLLLAGCFWFEAHAAARVRVSRERLLLQSSSLRTFIAFSRRNLGQT
jgi:hypothetical protein